MSKANLMKKSILLAIIGFGLLLFSSCRCMDDWWDDHGHGRDGSGDIVQEHRDVGAFHQIRMEGSMKIYITQGPYEPILLEGDDNILPIIDTRVMDGRLIIDSDHPYNSNRGIRVYVTMENIDQLVIDGSGAMYGENPITTDQLRLEIEGSGRFDLDVSAQDIISRLDGSGQFLLRGTADSHDINVDGSGQLKAGDLVTDHYEINVDGSAICRIYVRESLDVYINGAGIVYYRGNPATVHSQINGAGKVEEY